MLDKKIKKDFIWNTLGSSFVSFNSLFFMIIVTRINGIKEAGIFTLAYATLCMFYTIATYCGRTYQVTENDDAITDKDYIYNRMLTTIVMILILIFFCIFNGYTGKKILIFMLLGLLKIFEAFSDVYHGILQKNDKLDLVGISMFIRSLLEIIMFLIVDVLTHNLVLSCISIVVIGLLCLLIIDYRYSLKYRNVNDMISKKNIIKIFKGGFFIFGVSFIANYLTNAPRYVMDILLDIKYQTIFGIIIMPATIIILANQFLMQPMILRLKNFYNDNKTKKFLKNILLIIALTIVIGLIAIVIGYFIGIPFLELIYGIELSKYLYSLIIVLIGAIFYTISVVLVNALIILRKTKVQFYIYLFTAIFAYSISMFLVNKLGFIGGIYSYVLTMMMLLFIYIIVFIIIFKKEIKEGSDKNERKNK